MGMGSDAHTASWFPNSKGLSKALSLDNKNILCEVDATGAPVAGDHPNRITLLGAKWPNIGIVTAYNDMLSAHQPFERFPELIRHAARRNGATAQVAGGVPAMCDGVTQGREGMELSLFSRDNIAQGAALQIWPKVKARYSRLPVMSFLKRAL